jgi:hypothetical protein
MTRVSLSMRSKSKAWLPRLGDRRLATARAQFTT